MEEFDDQIKCSGFPEFGQCVGGFEFQSSVFEDEGLVEFPDGPWVAHLGEEIAQSNQERDGVEEDLLDDLDVIGKLAGIFFEGLQLESHCAEDGQERIEAFGCWVGANAVFTNHVIGQV